MPWQWVEEPWSGSLLSAFTACWLGRQEWQRVPLQAAKWWQERHLGLFLADHLAQSEALPRWRQAGSPWRWDQVAEQVEVTGLKRLPGLVVGCLLGGSPTAKPWHLSHVETAAWEEKLPPHLGEGCCWVHWRPGLVGVLNRGRGGSLPFSRASYLPSSKSQCAAASLELSSFLPTDGSGWEPR